MADKQMTVHVTISAADQASQKIKDASEKLAGLEQSLRKAQTASDDFGNRWSQSIKVAEGAGRGMMMAGGAITGLGALAVKAGSDFGEMSSMFDQVFKGQAAGARQWAETTADAVNRSAADMEKYAASFQALFVPMGFDRGPAAQMSETVTQLAVDLGSFYNVAEPDVIRDLQSAFAGETESMRKYGVFLSDAALDQELFNRGIKGGSQAATEQEKAQARLALILKATKDAQGDAARTSGGWANQLRGLQAEVMDIAVGAGQALVPALEELAPTLKDALSAVSDFVRTPAGETFVKWAAGTALVATGGGAVVSKLGDIVGGATQIGSLGKSMWDRFRGGVEDAKETTDTMSDALSMATPAVSKLDKALGSVGLTTTSAAIGIGVLALGVIEYGREAEAARAATEAFNKGLGDIAAGKASQDLEKWIADLREAAEAAREADNEAPGNRSGLPGDPTNPRQQEREHQAMTERALQKLREQEADARRRMQWLQRGSAEYLKAEAEAIKAHLGQLAIEREELMRKPLWKDPRMHSVGPGSIGAALDEGNARRQQLQDVKREADIYAARADRVAQALAALGDSQQQSQQQTKAQQKADEDALKAASSYTDALDARGKAAIEAGESIAQAAQRVTDAEKAIGDAILDGNDKVEKAQQDRADAYTEAGERVTEARNRVADATQRVTDAEEQASDSVKAALKAVDDARERSADASDQLRKAEESNAKQRVSIEKDAADKIEQLHKSTADKVASLTERLAELRGKLAEADPSRAQNVFTINGRQVMLSDEDAKRLRERQKLLQDIRKVEGEIAKAKADEKTKSSEITGDRDAKLKEHDAQAADRVREARKRAGEAEDAVGEAEDKANKAQRAADRQVDEAKKALKKAEDDLEKEKVASARRIIEAENAVVKAEEAAAKAVDDARQKLADAENQRSRTYVQIADKLRDVAEKLGVAWFGLQDKAGAAKVTPEAAVNQAAARKGQAIAAGATGMKIPPALAGVAGAGGMTSGDVGAAMAAFSALAGSAPPMHSYQTLARTHGSAMVAPHPAVQLGAAAASMPRGPVLSAPEIAGPQPTMLPPSSPLYKVFAQGVDEGGILAQKARSMGMQGAGGGGGAARVVVELAPGLVARELQQDPAKGVVVQIARATAAKSPGRSTY